MKETKYMQNFSDFKITCDNHKKNEIIDKIINVYKKYEISN